MTLRIDIIGKKVWEVCSGYDIGDISIDRACALPRNEYNTITVN